MKIVMHYNRSLPHQILHAAMFEQAGVETTTDRDAEADIHIVSGPHYCLDRWRGHPNLIWLDRAFWGDPQYVSLGWLCPDGARSFPKGASERPKPDLWEWGERESSALIVADYQQDVTDTVKRAHDHFDYVRVRKHPAESGNKDPFGHALMLSDVVIGHGSTALVEAAIRGKPVICTDPTNPVMPVSSDWGDIRRPDRRQWLHDLSWAQFNHDEIASGFALEALMACRNIS